MKTRNYLFTSESITEGHPDKVADQVSDAILDAILTQDATARVACETLVTTGLALVAGEITTTAQVHYPDVVRSTIKDIGYNDAAMGFDWQTCAVLTSFDRQSPDIAQGVDVGKGLYKEQGAGDQGLMFGYASNETDTFMPMPLYFAHRLSERLTKVRKDGVLKFLRPDGKTQVTVEYHGDTPQRIDTIVVSAQHTPEATLEAIREGLLQEVVTPTIPANLLDKNTKYLINPTGRFVQGGPHADCGLTGRKIIADTYGGMGSHGGGAFSGKDPSKVDRSASYVARYIAKNIVATGVVNKCEVQIAYAIGYPDPISFLVNGFGTAKVDPEKIQSAAREIFPLKPAAIIEQLKLQRPIYRDTAAYGHFGRNLPNFTWEQLDRVAALKQLLNV